MTRKKSTVERQKSMPERFSAMVLSLPRLVRILITVIFALMTILAVSPIVDELYLRFFFNPNTRILPSFVSMSLGLVMYIVGWRLIVGTLGEQQETKSVVVWYVVIGIFAMAIVGLWLLRLMALSNTSL